MMLGGLGNVKILLIFRLANKKDSSGIKTQYNSEGTPPSVHNK